MSSLIEIANMALDVIGTRATIASLTEGSTESAAISRHMPNAIDAILRSAHWNFARKQVALSLLQDGVNGGTVPIPWLYEYAYPSDCLLIRQIMPVIQGSGSSAVGTPSAVSAFGPPVQFILSTDNDNNGNPTNVILTNQAQAVGIYTFRNTNVQMWDALAVQALAAYLGARVCIPLTGDKNAQKTALTLAQDYTRQAQASNGNEGITVINNTPDWIRVRGFAADWAYPDSNMFTYGPQALTLIS